MKEPRAIDLPDIASLPYSSGTLLDDLVFCTGQTGRVRGTGTAVGPDIRSQTRKSLENLRDVLVAAGSSLEQVLKCTVYLTSPDDMRR